MNKIQIRALAKTQASNFLKIMVIIVTSKRIIKKKKFYCLVSKTNLFKIQM